MLIILVLINIYKFDDKLKLVMHVMKNDGLRFLTTISCLREMHPLPQLHISFRNVRRLYWYLLHHYYVYYSHCTSTSVMYLILTLRTSCYFYNLFQLHHAMLFLHPYCSHYTVALLLRVIFYMELPLLLLFLKLSLQYCYPCYIPVTQAIPVIFHITPAIPVIVLFLCYSCFPAIHVPLLFLVFPCSPAIPVIFMLLFLFLLYPCTRVPTLQFQVHGWYSCNPLLHHCRACYNLTALVIFVAISASAQPYYPCCRYYPCRPC